MLRQSGTTLIELIASIVIVSIATLGLMLVISGVVGHSADPMIEQQAAAVAEAYLEEVTLADFCDPDFLLPGQTCRTQCVASACASACGGSGALLEASRDLYDDICDYDGYSDAGAFDRNGNALPGLGGYNVSVTVDDSGFSLGAPPLSANAGAVVRIDVTVTHAALENAVTLSAYRTNSQ